LHLAINSEADWYAAPRRALLGNCRCGGGCGCGSMTHDDCGTLTIVRGLGFMGAAASITPRQAIEQAAQGETGSDFGPSGWVQKPNFEQIVVSGQVSASDWSPNCAGMPAPDVHMFQTASGLALGTSAAGVGILGLAHMIPMTAIPVVGAVIAGAGAVIAIIGTIFTHHSAAVRQEQQLGCAAIAAGNNAIALMDQAVRSGQMKPADAAAGLDTLLSKLSSFVAPAVKHNPCNANCELIVQFKAIVIYRKALYAAMGAVTSSNATAALPATSSGGLVVPAVQTVPGGGGTLVPMNTGPSGGTQADLVTGAVVQPAPASQTPSWLPIAAVVAGIVLFMGK
jgi:hypothetical protein